MEPITIPITLNTDRFNFMIQLLERNLEDVNNLSELLQSFDSFAQVRTLREAQIVIEEVIQGLKDGVMASYERWESDIEL